MPSKAEAMAPKIDIVEYTFIRQGNQVKVSKKRNTLAIILGFFQVAFIIAFWYYAKNMNYQEFKKDANADVTRFYSS